MDGFPDAVLGDSFGGSTITIFWGRTGGTFEPTPTELHHHRGRRPSRGRRSRQRRRPRHRRRRLEPPGLQARQHDPRAFATGTAQTLDTEDDPEFLSRRAWSPGTSTAAPTPTSISPSRPHRLLGRPERRSGAHLRERRRPGRSPRARPSTRRTTTPARSWSAPSTPAATPTWPSSAPTTTSLSENMFISLRLGSSLLTLRGRRPRSTSPLRKRAGSRRSRRGPPRRPGPRGERQRQLGERRRHVRPVHPGLGCGLPVRVLLRRLQQRQRPDIGVSGLPLTILTNQGGRASRSAGPITGADRTSASTAPPSISAPTRATTSSSARSSTSAPSSRSIRPRAGPRPVRPAAGGPPPTTPATAPPPGGDPPPSNPPAPARPHGPPVNPPLTQPVIPVRANQIATLPSNRQVRSRRSFKIRLRRPPAGVTVTSATRARQRQAGEGRARLAPDRAGRPPRPAEGQGHGDDPHHPVRRPHAARQARLPHLRDEEARLEALPEVARLSPARPRRRGPTPGRSCGTCWSAW